MIVNLMVMKSLIKVASKNQIFANMKLLLVIILTVGPVLSALPPSFKKCNRHSPEFNKCMLEAVQDAIKQMTRPFQEINLPSVDPLEVTSLSIRGSGASNIAVDQHFKNCHFHGPSKAKVQHYLLDFDRKIVEMKVQMTEMLVKCQYEIEGKVLLLPIKGKGDNTFTFENVGLDVNATFHIYTKRSKSYMAMDEIKIDLSPEQIKMNFNNLFDGDKELGDNLNKVLNENSQEVYQDVKPYYEEVMSHVIKTIFDQVFSKISLEEAFD